jgi:phosphatidylglycerol---prolipoprotein diacylglyceryl transferase
MKPILFTLGDVPVYSYGLLIAIGCVAGVAFMAIKGKKEVGLSFDQANNLFLIIFFAAVIGGKVFLFFEDPSGYLANPVSLVRGAGFVFYGSFLFTIPAMLWYFRKQNLPVLPMLDVMAVTTCIVHMFGRIGCFFAGCCHGKPTDSIMSVTFSDPACFANPKNVPLHPTQLYEAFFIGGLMLFLLARFERRKYCGELFVTYLACYAVGRYLLEFLRGDGQRGFIVEGILSHSQLIAALILLISVLLHFNWSKKKIELSQ